MSKFMWQCLPKVVNNSEVYEQKKISEIVGYLLLKILVKGLTAPLIYNFPIFSNTFEAKILKSIQVFFFGGGKGSCQDTSARFQKFTRRRSLDSRDFFFQFRGIVTRHKFTDCKKYQSNRYKA